LDLGEVTKLSAASWRFTALLAPDVKQRARTHFEQLLSYASLNSATLEFEPFATALVSSESSDTAILARKILGPFGFQIEQSGASLMLEPLVRVQIVVAEIKKNKRGAIGIDWPTTLEGQLLPVPKLPYDGVLRFGLNALETQGIGRILAEPTLLCRSGKEAQFLAGGEFPIKVSSFKNQSVSWKRHGVLLKIRPKADSSGRMSIAIEAEVSMIDAANTVDGIPGLLTNRIETHFDLTSSRTIVLSGLIKKEWANSAQGLAGLSSIPVLGPLFNSQEFRDQETELMIFVTPQIAQPGVKNVSKSN
jgi:pilus assembly protein CpaC